LCPPGIQPASSIRTLGLTSQRGRHPDAAARALSHCPGSPLAELSATESNMVLTDGCYSPSGRGSGPARCPAGQCPRVLPAGDHEPAAQV
jgi:hypothetical protein